MGTSISHKKFELVIMSISKVMPQNTISLIIKNQKSAENRNRSCDFSIRYPSKVPARYLVRIYDTSVLTIPEGIDLSKNFTISTTVCNEKMENVNI